MRVDDDPPSEERMNRHTERRKRRRANAAIKFGKNAVRAHRKLGGRTGHLQAKRTPAKRASYVVTRENPPGPTNLNLG